MDLLNLCRTSTYFQYNGKHSTNMEQLWADQFLLLLQKSLCKTSRNEPSQTNPTTVATLCIYFIYCFDFVVPPLITSISEDRTVNKGDLLLLRCTAGGYPAPNITWTRPSDNNVVTFPLTFTGKQDEGVYRCTADN